MIKIKTWLWLLFMPVVAYANVALKDIDFKDPAFAACLHQTAQKHNWHNVSEITRLKCHSMGITNAEEVVLFENLSYLSLYNNKLSQLDLTRLSKLEELNLANNRLETLNIQGLAQLKKLFLFRNRLKTINLSGLNEVQTVRLMQNHLVTLDITPLHQLKNGYFFDNKLEDLSIRGLDHLEFLDVRQNPMPDELYDFYDKQEGIVISHDGNADDWK